ncbi:MAG TPA: hypothetical protein VIM71_03565, partial [Lacunisphaera sp.]
HLLYLALSALEAHETARARELLHAVHVESDHASDKHFRLVVEKALVVQEAEPGAIRQETAATARQQLAHSSAGNVGRVLKAEVRAAAVMAKDAGGFGARLYAIRLGLRSRLGLRVTRRSSPISVWVIIVIVLVNALRACSSH